VRKRASTDLSLCGPNPDWYKKSTGRADYPLADDPGVLSVQRIYAYYKKYGHKTEVMGASFRNLGEIIELAGCDLLTISPSLLVNCKRLRASLPVTGSGERGQMPGFKSHFDERSFAGL